MADVLHILNGNSTADIFKQTSLKGDILIWREILSDGPVVKENLWSIRSDWYAITMGETAAGYAEKVIIEANKLQNALNYKEIILWFEFDLVCQINLIYILSILGEKYHPKQLITLVCPESVEGVSNFRGLGQLNSSQLEKLFSTRKKLTEIDFTIASAAWDLYVKNDYQKIEAFLLNDFGNLHLLKNALIAHLSRFPWQKSKLNHIEETLIGIVGEKGMNRAEIYEAFWTKEPIYGITDLQLGLILDKLVDQGLLPAKVSLT